MPKDTNDLGLPIEYKTLPEFFDSHNINKDTDNKNALIANLLKQHQAHTIYDMTCGTGSQVLYLAQRGYEIIGSDLCSDLIKQARLKAESLNLTVSLEVDDIRTAQRGQFDAVISIFSAIGHLSQPDFEIALNNIRHNLTDGGIYIFDIFNLQALTDEVISTFVMDIQQEANGVSFRNRQTSELDRENGLLISHDHYTIMNNNTIEEKTNTFALKIYTFEALKPILEKNGFEVVNLYDMDGNTFIPETSLNMLIVAKKTH